MALPVAFDPQGFPIVNAIVQGGGIIIPAVNLEAETVSQPGPDPSGIINATPVPLLAEPDHALRTRSRVLTDEGAFSDDFHGAALATALAGTCTFLAGNTAVVGAGTAFTTAFVVGDYIKANAHADTAWTQIDSITDDAHLTLVAGGYLGANAAGVASSWQHYISTEVTAGGVSAITVANSLLTMTMDGTNGASLQVVRTLGAGGHKKFAPIEIGFHLAISQRIANERTVFGVVDAAGTRHVSIALDGTDNTKGTLRLATSAAAADTTSNTFVIPAAAITSAMNDYVFLFAEEGVVLYVNNVPVSGGPLHIPEPYTAMSAYVRVSETAAAAGGTIVTVDQINIRNFNRVDAVVYQPDTSKLRASVIDIGAFATGVPRAPTAIADNLVHELTNPAGNGMDMYKHYDVQQIGGADLCVYVAAAAPAVATCRYGMHVYNGIDRSFSPTQAGQRLWGVKAVDGTADMNVSCWATDGGGGA
jgi:hypothetical protein